MFKQVQHQFVEAIRDPAAQVSFNDVETRRLNVYRDLMFNNVLGFLDSGFPVLKSLYTKGSWQQLAREFFKTHDCKSPYFVDISREFVEFLHAEYQPTSDDPPFLTELAHYEWLELHVSSKPEGQSKYLRSKQQGTQYHFSELAVLASYAFPVHQISRDFQPDTSQGQVYIVVHRNNDDEVNFLLINEITAHLLNYMAADNIGKSYKQLVTHMSSLLVSLNDTQLREGLRVTVDNLLKQEILIQTE